MLNISYDYASGAGFSLGSQKLLVVVARPGGINNQPTRFGLTHRPIIQHRRIQSVPSCDQTGESMSK